jgi:surface protein
MNGMFIRATAFNQDISDWNVSNVTNFSLFMLEKSAANYSATNLDSIYNGWSSRPVQPNLNITFGTIKYTAAGQAGKDILTGAPNLWTSVDGGILNETEYQAVLDYATTQTYTLPTVPQRNQQNLLLYNLKQSGVWNKLDTFTVLATDGDEDFALIDWKRLVTHTEINSPTFIPNVGYQGNGTSSFIQTSYNPTLNGTNYVLGDGSFGYYMNTYDTAPSTTESIWGQNDVFNAFAWLRYTTKQLYFNTDVFGGFFPYVNFVNSNNSFVQVNNTSLTGVNIYKNGSLTDSGNLSSTPFQIPNGPFIALNYRGNFSDAIISILYAGGNLTSQASSFNTIISNYITSL